MTGHHLVRIFDFYPESSIPLRLPEGWKPFNAYVHFDTGNRIVLKIVARKWVRADDKEPSEGV